MNQSRQLEFLVAGREVSDGAGVKLRRVLTQDLQERLDPFLMLDAFLSENPDDYLAGFPDHPHRGFETVTYMLTGRLEHHDNHGGHGVLQAGGVQWMTAGRGIVHSEFPRQDEGLMHGFQLWLNLPSADKLCDPGYEDIPAETIPQYLDESGAKVKVIAGISNGVAGAKQRPVTEPLYVDIEIPANTEFFHELPEGHNAFVFVDEGEVLVEGRKIPRQHMGVLAQTAGANGVHLLASERPAHLLLIAGNPLREPIAQWGPFVMNTHEEIERAIQDFRDGKF